MKMNLFYGSLLSRLQTLNLSKAETSNTPKSCLLRSLCQTYLGDVKSDELILIT